MIKKSDILSASREYFDQKFSEVPFEAGVSYVPVSGKVLDADDCASLVDAWVRRRAYLSRQLCEEMA